MSIYERIWQWYTGGPNPMVWEYVGPGGRVVYRSLHKPALPIWPRVRPVPVGIWRAEIAGADE